jgi:hypothetical protein
VSEDERRAVAEAHADRERGIEPAPLENVLAEFDGVVSSAIASRRLPNPSIYAAFEPEPTVGDPGFEPGTSSLSEKRSNQLS